MMRAIKLTRKVEPGLGVAERSGIIVAASRRYHTRIDHAVTDGVVRRLALGPVVSAFRGGLTAGTHVAVEQAARARLGGVPTTPEQQAAGRRMVLAGTAGTVVAGLALQRFINHSHMHGAIAEAGRFVGSQLAIGGAACALVMGTDTALGRPANQQVSAGTAAALAATAIAQSTVLARIAPRLTLPPPPREVTIPVQGRWLVHDRSLPLAG